MINADDRTKLRQKGGGGLGGGEPCVNHDGDDNRRNAIKQKVYLW